MSKRKFGADPTVSDISLTDLIENLEVLFVDEERAQKRHPTQKRQRNLRRLDEALELLVGCE